MGSGTMPSGSTPRSMTAVATPVVQLSINKKRASDDGKVIIGGIYSNASITEAFYFRELGLYAQLQLVDGSFSEEVLYAYANAGSSADLMAAASSAVIEKQIDLVTYIGSDTQIDLTIESGAYIPFTDKGAPGGVAALGDDGKVPAAQLPAMDFDPAGSAAAVQTALSGHTGDNVRHLTAAERTAWNAKAAGDHTHTAAQVGAVAERTRPGTSGRRWGSHLNMKMIRHEHAAIVNEQNIKNQEQQQRQSAASARLVNMT
ncbi:MAG: hypothetical protein ACLSAF_00085 [Intestinimonas sp.]